MSTDLIVYLKRERMPTPAGWQAAITAASFPLVLDHEFNPFDFGGFLPCTYETTSSGFEYYAGPLEQGDPSLPEGRDFDFSVTFAIRTGAKQLQTASAAASALCHASGGLLVDPQSGAEIETITVIDWARSMIKLGDSEGL